MLCCFVFLSEYLSIHVHVLYFIGQVQSEGKLQPSTEEETSEEEEERERWWTGEVS